MEKQWKIKSQGDPALVNSLADLLNVSKDENNLQDKKTYEIVARLLVQRGITNYDEAKDFFRPNINNLHDPFLMCDMEKAVERISVAVEAEEKILVYGDYDVDGTSAVALVYSYLKKFYNNVDFYIPDRYTEGYGVSDKSVRWAIDNEVKLIICLDCGIKAIEQIDEANKHNIDFIIADHHLPGNELPNAYAILDPKRSQCQYPYKELSGCGVGFKLIQAIQIKRGRAFHRILKYLDLVAISIAADIVPITGENRVLVSEGLKIINNRPRIGIETLLKFSNIIHDEENESQYYFNKEVTLNDLVFSVGPRINAAGRMESGRNAVELLICRDEETANEHACLINAYNDERKQKDTIATMEAKEKLNNDPLNATKKATVIFKEDWHKGIIGIVASRLVEEYYKPTIVLTESNDLVTGSARSTKDFDIYAAIDHCSDLLEHFGGHKFAAGLSLKKENLQAFQDKFEKYVAEHITTAQTVPVIDVDMEISLKDITPKLYRIIKQFAPFGPDNLVPTFQSNCLIGTEDVKPVGKNHLKFSAIHMDISSLPFSCIGFGLIEYYDTIKKNNLFDMCYHIDENLWNGKRSIQLIIQDIHFRKKEI